MLYLYTIMMFAWDMDEDTHSYFRRYLDVFINKRKISKDLREFLPAPAGWARPWPRTYNMSQTRDEKHKINELRISLPYRVGLPTQHLRNGQDLRRPKLIEDIHPPEYYHDARKLSAPSRPHTNP